MKIENIIVTMEIIAKIVIYCIKNEEIANAQFYRKNGK